MGPLMKRYGGEKVGGKWVSHEKTGGKKKNGGKWGSGESCNTI